MAIISTLGAATDWVIEQVHEDTTGSKYLNRDHVMKFLSDGQTDLLDDKWWPFLEKDINFDSIIDQELTSNDATSITFADSSGFKDSGAVLVGKNIVTYIGNDDTDLTGCSINATFNANTIVKQLYEIETDLGITDFEKPIKLSTGVTKYDLVDPRNLYESDEFSVYDRSGTKYLMLPNQAEINPFTFQYSIEVVEIEDEEATFVIPSKDINILLQYALYNVKLQLELINANVANLNHIRLKRKFKQKYSKQTHDTDNYIQSIYNQR